MTFHFRRSPFTIYLNNGRMKRAIVIFSFILNFLGLAIFGQVIFEEDFEAGQSHLVKAITAKSSEMEIIENNFIDEWPVKNGTGIIDYDVPDRKEVFHYKKRNGGKLTGLSGIRKNHLKGADVRFGSSKGWITQASNLKIQSHRTIYGGSSIFAGEKSPDPVEANLFIPKQKQIFYRFYTVFLPPTLLSGTATSPEEYGFYFCGLSEIVKPGHKSIIRLWVVDIFSDKPKLQVRYWNTNGRINKTLSQVIKWEKPYCIEIYSKVGDTRDCGLEIFCNGKNIFSDLNQNISQVSGISETGFSKNCLTGTQIVCPVILDQIKIAQNYIGTIPQIPEHISIKKPGMIKLYAPDFQNQKIMSYQILVNNINSWIFPLHNSGELALPADKLLSLPPGLSPADSILLRIRLKNNFENWGPYSGSFRLTGISTRAPKVIINKIKVSKKMKGKALEKIEIGKWNYITILPVNDSCFNQISTLRVWINAASNSLGNFINKGGLYDPENNLILSFDPETGRLFGRVPESRFSSFLITNNKGVYYDDRGNIFKHQLKTKRLTTKFKIPEKAEPGLWIINAQVEDKKGNPSALIKRMIIVKERAKSGRIGYGIVIIAILIGIGFLAFIKTRTREESPVPLDREEELIQKSIDYIRDNYGAIKSVQEISQSIGLSHEYFRKMFKKKQGHRINEYLVNYRINKACDLILKTNMNINEVMDKVGINDLSYFTKTFKKITKLSPTKFRQKHRK
jgi:AraC-like DNA-binding protein